MPSTIRIEQRNGKRILRLPDDLQLEDDRYVLKKVGSIVYLIPLNDPWSGMLEAASEFTDDFLQERIQPHSDKREELE
jgi:antitoxin VapB